MYNGTNKYTVKLHVWRVIYNRISYVRFRSFVCLRVYPLTVCLRVNGTMAIYILLHQRLWYAIWIRLYFHSFLSLRIPLFTLFILLRFFPFVVLLSHFQLYFFPWFLVVVSLTLSFFHLRTFLLVYFPSPCRYFCCRYVLSFIQFIFLSRSVLFRFGFFCVWVWVCVSFSPLFTRLVFFLCSVLCFKMENLINFSSESFSVTQFALTTVC